MFIDETTVYVRSGKGGDGCVSYLRMKYIPKGGPDGGDGGRGGDVILLADPNVETLQDFTGRHHWRAGNGQPGGPKQQTGANGEDVTLHLPPGTLVYRQPLPRRAVDAVAQADEARDPLMEMLGLADVPDPEAAVAAMQRFDRDFDPNDRDYFNRDPDNNANDAAESADGQAADHSDHDHSDHDYPDHIDAANPTPDTPDTPNTPDPTREEFVIDLDEPGRRYVVARGGKGGFGNEHFKSPTNQAPDHATPGEPAQEYRLRLELKLVADVGLVGKPNAGKSTLLSRISRASPKIADYPFTTLAPQLGIATLSNHRRLVVADIPGLIENASQGAGLGTRFLRHVERTRVLIHLLDADPLDRSDPADNYRAIRRELEAHSPALAAKPELIALSKMDLHATEADRRVAVELLADALGRDPADILPISSATGLGLDALLERVHARVAEVKQARAAEPQRIDRDPNLRPGGWSAE